MSFNDLKARKSIIIPIVLLLCIIILVILVFRRNNVIPTISFDESQITMHVGEYKEISPIVKNIDNYTLSWQSSNPQVATIDNGIVNALMKGNTTITVTIENFSVSTSINIIVDNIYPDSIKLDQNEIEMFIDESYTLNYTLLPDNVTNKEVTWEVDDNGILTINNGSITPLRVGKTYLKVTASNGISDRCLVTIKGREIDVTSITFDKDNYSVYLGETIEIKATVLPSDATNKELIWTSSNTSIATIDNGVVTPNNKGSVTITATDIKGQIKKTANVTVLKRIVNINPSEITIVGDSRMVQLCKYKWYTNEGGTCIAKSAMGYNWLVDTAIPEVNKLVSSKKKNIVVNLGVNDLGNINKYVTKYQELATNNWNDYHIFVLSVNPTSGSRDNLNTKIVNFNDKIKSLANYQNVTYCDSYNYLKNNGFKATDGVHYNQETSQKIYGFIKDCIYKYYNE